MTSLKAVELLTLASATTIAAVPWHNMQFIPTPLLIFIAVGAGLAVVMIPADRRSVSMSITTALAGLCVGILFTEWIIEAFAIVSPAAAKGIAGLLGLGGLPIAGMALHLIDWATNNPQTWIGKVLSLIVPPKQNPPPPENQ